MNLAHVLPLWVTLPLLVLGGLVYLGAVLLGLAVLIGGEQLVDELVDDVARLTRLVRRCGHREPSEIRAHRRWLVRLSRPDAGGRGLPTGRHHHRGTPASTTPASLDTPDRSPVNTPPALDEPPALEASPSPAACPVCRRRPVLVGSSFLVTQHGAECSPYLVAKANR